MEHGKLFTQVNLIPLGAFTSFDGVDLKENIEWTSSIDM